MLLTRDTMVKWIENWPLDRRQKALVGGVISGQSKRSTPGPLLFLVYINVINNNTASNTLKF